MPQPGSHNFITVNLHNLSSLIKLFSIGILWFFVCFGQEIFPGFVLKNHQTLIIIISLAFFTNLLTEYIVNLQKQSLKSCCSILESQIILNTVLLLLFLALFDHINGPLFLVCLITLMEASLNLNINSLLIVFSLMSAAVILEWIALVITFQITPDLFNIIAFSIRLITLVSITSYGKSLSASIIAAREVDDMKDEFISVASHELRTPMTAIKSYLWMAINGQTGKLNPKQKFYLKRSYNSTDRLIKLVNDMLNISRIESGRMSLSFEKVSLYNLTKDVVESFSSQAKIAKVKIMVKPYHVNSDVIADADKIKEVFYNLIGNAVKFTPEKGKVIIDFYPAKNFIITNITDTGLGMTAENVKNLFQKFGLVRGSYQTNQTANANSQGTGLGLYICKQIITLHRGQIWGKSPGSDQGSVFSFSLPVYTPAKLKQYQRQFEHPSDIGIIHSKIYS